MVYKLRKTQKLRVWQFKSHFWSVKYQSVNRPKQFLLMFSWLNTWHWTVMSCYSVCSSWFQISCEHAQYMMLNWFCFKQEGTIRTFSQPPLNIPKNDFYCSPFILMVCASVNCTYFVVEVTTEVVSFTVMYGVVSNILRVLGFRVTFPLMVQENGSKKFTSHFW